MSNNNNNMVTISNNMGWFEWNSWKKKLREKEEKLLIKVDEGVKSSVTRKYYNDVPFVIIFSIFIAVSGSFVYGFAKNKLGEEKDQLLVERDEEMKSSASSNYKELTFVLSISTAVSSSFVVGFASGYSSPVESQILKDLNLSSAQYSVFGSIMTVGGLFGALVSGKLTDFIGRKGTMGLSSLISFGGWLSIVYSQGSMSLDTGRLALGIASGLSTYAIPVYIAEISPKNLRGGLVLVHQLVICSGIAVAFIVGLITSWRALALIGTIPCMIQLLGLFFIPESPRWLMTNSSEEAFEAVLKRFRGENTDISQEAAEIKEHSKADKSVSVNIFDVFNKRYAYALIVALGLKVLSIFGGTDGILYYAAAIFESARVSITKGTIAMALIQLPTTALGVSLMDKCGRRSLLVFSAAGMGTACFLVALSFLFKAHGWMVDFSPYFALVGIMTFAATYPVGMGGIPSIIMSEMFPMDAKGAAGSIVIFVGFTCSWIVTYTFHLMMQWSSYGTFFIFMGFNILSLLFITKLVPETKGRTLEEIQELVTYK